MTTTREPYRGEPPHQAHSTTSTAAADSVAPSAGTWRRRVYQALVAELPDGLTDEQLASQLGMRANTERPRRRELQLTGHVVDSGQRRLVRSGRQAVVWRAVREDEGRRCHHDRELCSHGCQAGRCQRAAQAAAELGQVRRPQVDLATQRAADSWRLVADEAQRLDQLARPGGRMDEDDLVDLVLRVLREAARRDPLFWLSEAARRDPRVQRAEQQPQPGKVARWGQVVSTARRVVQARRPSLDLSEDDILAIVLEGLANADQVLDEALREQGIDPDPSADPTLATGKPVAQPGPCACGQGYDSDGDGDCPRCAPAVVEQQRPATDDDLATLADEALPGQVSLFPPLTGGTE